MKKRYHYRPALGLGQALRVSLMVGTCLGCSVGIAIAGPEGGVVSGGSATISQAGNSTTINQSSNRALIDWDSFNVDQHESVNFVQNGASSIAVNRIHDANPSTILGSLTANGQIILINPNGVVFGGGSQVDVGSLVVSTASPTEQDAQKFISGQSNQLNLSVPGNPNARIINTGNITARDAGLVGFVAPGVINNGVIIANGGTVQLASGDMATVDLYGDGLVDVAVSPLVQQQLIEQNGWVQADGGKVVISAAAGEQIINSVINMGGVTQAHSIDQKDGKIILKGNDATINVTGKIDVSGKAIGQTGGEITATAKHINLKAGSTLDASGDKGGGTIKLGGDYKGLGDLPHALTLTMEQGSTIYNDAISQGDGGTTILWSDDHTYFAGDIFGRGGAQSGNGGFVETSGKQDLSARGSIDLRAFNGDAGTWLLDPADITIYNRSQGGTDNVNTVTTAYLEGQNAHINLLADNNITLDLTGDTLTLGNGYNLTLTATSGDIITASAGAMTTSGTGSILLNAGQDISFAHDLDLTAGGSGSVTLQANRNIIYSGAGDITTNGGHIVLNSDRDVTNGGAISLGTGTEIKSNGGNITLGGGTNPDSTVAMGIASYKQGISLTSATIDARGVASGGNIIMNGTGDAGSTASNPLLSAHGILLNGSSVQTNFAGTLTARGTGGGTGAAGLNVGVYVYNGSSLSVVNGLMSVTATGGTGSGGQNYGIVFSSSGINKIESLGSGNINVTGTASSSVGNSHGIAILGTATNGIFSTSGTITLTGQSDGTNFGIVGSGNSGTIGGANATGTITLITDKIGDSNIGIQTTGDVIIRPYTAGTTVGVGTGAGTLAITSAVLNGINYGGTLWLGGYGLTNADAGYINEAGLMTVDTTRTFTKSVVFSSLAGITTSNTLTASGTANVTLSSGTGVLTTGTITLGSGNLTMMADSIVWNGNLSGTGTFYLQPYSANRGFNIASGGSVGYLFLGGANNQVARIQSGWSSLVLGSSRMTNNLLLGNVPWAHNVSVITGSGDIRLSGGAATMAADKSLTLTTISGDITTPYLVGSYTTSGTGTITLNSGRDILFTSIDYDLNSASGTIRLNANRNIVFNSSSDITTAGGHIILNADRDAANGGSISLGSGTLITSNGGNITLGGGADPETVAAIGTSSYGQGIVLNGATINANGTSSGGHIMMRGTGGASVVGTDQTTDVAHGIFLNGATVQTNNSGTVTMSATGGGTGVTGSGIFIYNTSAITAVNGLMSVTGTGANGANGLLFSGTGTNKIQSTGSGNMEISGTAVTNGSGIFINSSTGGILSATGKVTVTGIGAGASGYGLGGGATAPAIGGASATGLITLIADKVFTTMAPNIQTSGDVVIRPYTNGQLVYVGSGGTTSNLQLTNTFLGSIAAGGTLWLGGYGLTGLETGYWNSAGDLTLNTTRSFAGNVNFLSGGHILSGGDSTITLTGSANTTLWAAGNILISHDLDITSSGTGSITQRAGGSIAYSGSGDITTTGGTITLNSDRDATNGGAISLSTGTEIKSNGGDITLGGGTDPITGFATGNSTYKNGVGIFSASLDGGGGNIILNGQGWSDAACNNSCYGVITSSATIGTSGTGSISINGIGGGTGATNYNHGILIGTTSIMAVNGNINLTGRVSDLGANSASVSLYNSSSLSTSGGTGNINLTANGTLGLGLSQVAGSNTVTAGGNITYIGDTISAGANNFTWNAAGDVIIRPYTAGTTVGVGSGAIGTLAINDTFLNNITYGGTLWFGGYGLTGLEAGYWNSSGNLTLFETRSFGKNVNVLSGANIISGGNSTITLTGTANSVIWAKGDMLISHDQDITASGSGSVTLRAGGSIVYSGSGDITTNGSEIVLNADRDTVNGGIISLATGTILTSNGGNITLGGGIDPTTGYAQGYNSSASVRLSGGATLDARGATTTSGNIIVNGRGWSDASCSNNCYGIQLHGSTVITNNNGSVLFDGITGGTSSSTSLAGISIINGSTVSAVNGLISFTADTVSNSSTTNVISFNNSTVSTTGTGDITFFVKTASGLASYGIGNYGAASSISSGGKFTYAGNSLYGSAVPTISAVSDIIIRPYTAGVTVGVGSGTGTLAITDAFLNNLTYGGTLWLGGYGLTGLETGYWNSAGTLTLNTTRSFAGNVNFLSGGNIVSGADSTITLTGGASTTLWAVGDILMSHDLDITASGTGSVTQRSGGNIVYNAGGDISTNGGMITLNADRDQTNGGAIYLGSGVSLLSNGGNITLGGGANPETTAAIGTSTYLQGIYFGAANIDARGTVSGGNISLRGTGWANSLDTGPTGAIGIFSTGSTIQSNFNGNVTLTGSASGLATSGYNIGVFLYGSTVVSAVNGTISVTGTGGVSGTGYGVALSSSGNSKIESTGSGDINVTATAANTHALLLNATGGGIFSKNGNITLIANGLSSGIANTQASVSAGTIGGANATGRITLVTSGFHWQSGTVTPIIQTTGDVVIRPYADGTTVGIGTGAGTLRISDDLLNNTTYGGTLWLGGYGLNASDTGYWNASGLMTLATTRSFANNVNFLSGNSINSSANGTITLTGAANTTLWALGNINIAHDLDITVSGTGSVTQRAGRTITYSAGGDISTNGGTITLNADRDETNGGAIYLGIGTSLLSNGGNIILGGGANPEVTSAIGLTSYASGVNLVGANIDARGASTTGGNITMNGTGWAASTVDDILTGAHGIMLNGSSVQTNNSGTITLIGAGAGTGAGGSNIGIYLYNNARVTGVNGAVSLTGIGGAGSAGGNYGIAFSSAGINKVESLGSGDISLSGTSSNSNNNSIVLNSSSGGVLSKTGSVSLMGITTGNNGIALNWGTIGGVNATGAINITSNRYIYLGGTTSTTGNGTITMNAGTQISSVTALNVTSVNGTISLTGSSGIILGHAANLTSTGGNVTLNSAVTSSVAQTFQAGGTLTAGAITMGANNLTLNANDMVLNGDLTGTGTLTLQQYSINRIMNIGTGTDNNTSLHLGSGDLSKLVNGWGLINLGRTDGSNFMYVGTTNWTDAVNFRSSYSKNISGTIGLTGGAATTLTVTNNADIYAAITTDGGAVDVTSYAYGYGGSITTNGGAVTIGHITTYNTGSGLTINSGNGNISFGTIGTNTFAANPSRSFVFNAGTGTVAFGGVVDTDGSITATGGNITFNGAWGGSRAVGNVSLTSANSISLPSITTAAGKTVAATVTGANGKITTSSIATGTDGSISLTADDLDITGALSGTGTLTLQPYDSARVININRSTDNGSTFYLSTDELGHFTNNWGLINIGRTDGAADLNVGLSSWIDPVNFRNAYRVTTYDVTGTDNASFTFTGSSAWTDLRGTLSTQGQDIFFNNGSNYSVVSFTDGNITTNGGHVTLSKAFRISSTGNRSITTNGGNINLNGGIKESSSPVSGTTLTLDAGAGTIAFGNTVNTLINITALSNAMTFNGAWGGNDTLGNVTLTSANSISLPSMILTAGKAFNATVTGANGKITASSIAVGTGGNITLTADDLALNGNLSGTGALILQPNDTNRIININDGTDDGSNLNLSTAEIGRLVNGWANGITIGKSTNLGLMSINTSNWYDNVTFRGSSAGRNIYGTVTAYDGASLTFYGANNARLYGAVVTNGGAVTMRGNFIAYNGSVTTNGGQFEILNGGMNSFSASGDLTVNTSGGDIKFTSIIGSGTGKNISLNAGSGSIIFDTVNGDYNITATGGTISTPATWGDVTPLGTVSLTATNSITLPSITASSVFIRTTGASSDITIGSGKVLTSSGANGITLVAGRNFINDAGAGALVAGGTGRWLVYSTNVTGTTGEEDLANNFNRYSCTYGGTCPTLGTGNGLLYSYTPLLTVTPTIVNVTYGNNASGLNNYIYSLAGYLGSDGSADSVTGTLNGVTDYVTGDDVGSYYLNHNSGSLASAMGYGFTYANKANGVNVTPRVLTASLTGNVTKVYDDDTDAALLVGNYLLSNVYSNDDVTLGNITAGTYNNENAGTGKTVSVNGLVLNGGKASNYTLASNNISGNIGTITPKGLVVTATAGQNKTYGQSDAAFAYTYTGLVGNDSSATFTGALSRAAGNNAGLYAINQGNLAATGNYTVSSFVASDYTINKATINITAPNGSRYYGYDNLNYNWSNATITGLQYGETGAVLDNLAFSIAGSATPTANAGTTHAVALGGFSDNNYTLGSFTGGTLSIAKAPLTITADSYIRVMIMPMPALTASYSGLRNDETSSVVSGLVLSTADSNGAPFGSYSITASGGTAANYVITHVNGTALVTPGLLPNTIVNPNAVVQTDSTGNQPGGNTSTETKDAVALLDSPDNNPSTTVQGKTSGEHYMYNDPLVTFTPELREILGI